MRGQSVKKGTVVDISGKLAMERLKNLYCSMPPGEQERTIDYLERLDTNTEKVRNARPGMDSQSKDVRTPTNREPSAVAPPTPSPFVIVSLRRNPMSKSEGYIFPFFNTERRIGEFSRELETHERIRTDLTANHDGEQIQTKTQALKDVGIDIAHALDAERKMGETLLETDRAKGARLEGKNIGGTPIQPPKDGTPTLAEIGVTKHGVSYD